MKNEIIIYQTDETSTRLEVRIEEEALWLTQAQMCLFVALEKVDTYP